MSMNYSKKTKQIVITSFLTLYNLHRTPVAVQMKPYPTHSPLLHSTPPTWPPGERLILSLLVIDYGSAFNTIVPLGSLTKLSYLGLYSSDSGTCGSWSIITWMGSFTQQDRLALRKAGYSADKTIKATPLKSERHQQCRTRAKRIAGNPNSQQQIVFSVVIRETLWSTGDQDRNRRSI